MRKDSMLFTTFITWFTSIANKVNMASSLMEMINLLDDRSLKYLMPTIRNINHFLFTLISSGTE